jgi:hypothetical protein
VVLCLGLLVAGLAAGAIAPRQGVYAARTAADSGGPTAQQLLAKVKSCTQISSGRYKTDDETSRTIPVCQSSGVVFWKADMDIDCDGVRSSACNEDTDPWFQPDTAAHTSTDKPLNAASLPYVVLPSPSSTWDYRKHNIQLGAVIAVIYNNQVTYAVAGDTGPTAIIGEASYATAKSLGIDPDPETGGTDTGVTYIVFPGSKVSPIESHSKAVSVGQSLAWQLVNR